MSEELDPITLERARNFLLSAAERLSEELGDEVVGGALLAALIDYMQGRWGAEFASLKLAGASADIYQAIGRGDTN